MPKKNTALHEQQDRLIELLNRRLADASEQASELQDADTAAIFTEIARGIDTWLWFVETSQQAGN